MLDHYAAAQCAALTTAAEAAILGGATTAAEAAGPTLEDIAATHARADRVRRYIDAVEAHAPDELARLNSVLDVAKDREALRRLVILQGVVEHLDTARMLLADDHLLSALIAARLGGPITPALRVWGLVDTDGQHEGLNDRAICALRVITAALAA